jgi:hypothetical protein
MFAGMEVEHLMIWLESRYVSSLGIVRVRS